MMRSMGIPAPRAVLVLLGLLACSATPIQVPPTPARQASPALTSRVAASPAAQPSDASVTTRAQTFADAYAAMRSGRNDAARAGFAESAKVLPELADHALYHQAHLAREAGATAEARDAIGRLMVEHPDSVWLAAAAVDRGQIALDDGAPDEAATWFGRALDAKDASTAAAAKIGLAKAEIARGRRAPAYDLVDGLRGRPGTIGSEARTLGESLEADGTAQLGIAPDELRLRMARARLREGRAAEARAALEPLRREGNPLRGEAALVEARSYGKASPAEAAAAYEVAIRSSNAADVAGTALHERGKAAWNRDEDAAADADFALLVERFPSHQAAPEALAARARIAQGRADIPGAIALYEQVSVTYPESRFAEDSSWRAGFLRYQTGTYREAAGAFAALGDRDDALYWQARALDKAGDTDAARAQLAALREKSPAGYFGWWVDDRIGPPRTRPAYPRANERAAGTRAMPSLGGVAAYHYGRGQILASLGLPSDAVREFAAVEDVTGPDPFLLDAYRDAGAWNALVRTGIRLQQNGQAGYEDALYPQPYAAEFARAAGRAGIDPLLLVAMARQESLFDPAALSPAGARGVLQLMPGTATLVAGQPVSPDSLNDPSLNIDLGVRYLDGLLERFDGRIVLAVAAYNAGPEAVDRWIARAPDASGDEFVERISYRETRDYVKAVLRNYRAYHLLYGDRDLPKPVLY